MPQTDELVSDDSDSVVPPYVDVNQLAAALRRCCINATHQLTESRHADLKKVVERLLKRLCRRSGANDAHLFRVRLDKPDSGIIGLRYQGSLRSNHLDLSFLGHFQYQLISPRVRNCLENGQIALIRSVSHGGGRMLTGLMNQLACDSYLLCPICIDGRLLGILGVSQTENSRLSHDAECLELLKLAGAILLNHIRRNRREYRRDRRLRKWRKIANQACDFSISVDASGKIFDTTPFGIAAATPPLDGLRLTDVVSRNFYIEFRTQIKRSVQTATVRTCDFQLNLGADGPVWYLARIEPERNAQDAVVTLYLTNNNADKVLSEENRMLTDRLLKASRLTLLGQMSTEFAHQLNQPLQAIMNYCNTMQRRLQKGTVTTENSITALSNIENSVDHSARIIHRIRDFIRFQILREEEITVDEVIDNAVMMVLPTIRGAHGDLLTPESFSGQVVLVDRTQTTHVLINLMINALEACTEFGTEHPVIELTISRLADEGKVLIEVCDNGPGLPAEDPDIVFGKFYSGKKEGLGMGLAISREICETQGGSLTARNNDGEGCTFSLTLPLPDRDNTDTAEVPIIPIQTLPPD